MVVMYKKKCPQCGDRDLYNGCDVCERCCEERDAGHEETEMISVSLSYLNYLQDRVRRLEAVLKGVPG